MELSAKGGLMAGAAGQSAWTGWAGRQLDLVPQVVGAPHATGPGQALHGHEPVPELGRSLSQRRVRVQTEMPGDVDDRKHRVAELLVDARSRTPLRGESHLQLRELLPDLGPRPGRIFPIETNRSRL